MAGVTRNLKLRLADDLTADARFNLERIDQLGSVFPIDNTATQVINSSSSIRLNANATSLGGDGNGLVFAPNLQLSSTLKFESGPYELTLQPGSLTADTTFTLPPNAGTAGQFLITDGAGTLSFGDAPTENFSSLNDTTFTNLTAGQIAQYDGTRWVNANISATRQTGVFQWNPAEGNTKLITHNFSSTFIQVWIYEPGCKSQVMIETIDYPDSDTILLTAHSAPESTYDVHLIQTI